MAIKNFNILSKEGYRMLNISVYGDNSKARYAAVWVQRSGPAWQAIHGVSATTYQKWFDTNQ